MTPSSVKLRLAPLAPALASLVAATALLWYVLPAFLERHVARQLLANIEVLAPLVAPQVEADLQAWVRQLPAGSDLRVTVISTDGTVLADSAVESRLVPRMDNHAGRPEVRAALAAGEGWAARRSGTTGRQYVYAARTFEAAADRRLVLRLARPLEHVGGLRLRLLVTLVPALAAAMAAMVMVSWWLDRRLFRPLTTLIDGAGRLATGHYEHRLEVPEDEELAPLARALNQLAAGVEEHIAAAEAERDHLRTILARMSEGVLVVDPNGRALLANRAFRRLFGLTGEVAGRAPLEITRQPQLARIIDSSLSHGSEETAELELRLPQRRTLSLASTSLGRGAGAVVVARDTTAFTRLAEIRRDFVANVSHELKTPLSAIRGFAETLRDGALDDRTTAGRFTERILVQCRRLQALLEDLLVLSRLESVDHTTLPLEPLALDPVIQRAVEVVADLAREKEVALTVEGQSETLVMGHAESLDRLLVNLLDNAVKYNRPGGRVRVELAARGEGVVLEVADTGIGIPADSLPRLFERFYRVDKGRSRAEGGTGLGLAIVKHIAQLHGGRVEVTSREGKGSTFRVFLPRADAS